MSATVWFKGDWLDLPSGTYIARCPDWQRAELERIVEELRTQGTLPDEVGRPLRGGGWEICVRGMGQVVTHRCWLREDEPERRTTTRLRPRYDALFVRVPVDRFVEASDFLKDVQRPEDRAWLGDVFNRILQGHPVRPEEARQVEEDEWDVFFQVKFAGTTTLRVRLGTTDPNWGRPGT